MGFVRDRGAVFGAVAGTFPALLAHDPLHGAPRHVVALAAQPDPQLACPERLDELAGLLVLALRGDDRDQLGIGQLPPGGRPSRT